MYNLTEASKKTNILNTKSTKNDRNILRTSVELNFNSPSINNLKFKLEKNIIPMNVNIKNNAFPLLNKTPILIKDKMGNGVN